MKKIISTFLLLTMWLNMGGCAAVMAVNQPAKVDEGVLAVGMPRDSVMAELGAPISTDTIAGKKTDIFKFQQGYSTGVKVCRMVFHVVADVFTLFLWELIGMPTETIYAGKKKAIRVTYDQQNNVETVLTLKES